MSEDISLPNWGDKKHSIMGNTNRAARFEKAAMALAKCITRNRGSSKKGAESQFWSREKETRKLSGPLDSRVLSRR